MKRRVSNSEIELAKKSSKILFLISFLLLILLFIGFGVLYFMDVDLVSYVSIPKKENVSTTPLEKTKKSVSVEAVMEDGPVSLDVKDSNLTRLFEVVKVTNKNDCDDYRYGNKPSVLASSLSSKCRYSIASNIYDKNIKTALDGRLYVKESDVKSAYESLYGNGTYVKQDSIPCLYKTEFMYNDNIYFTQKVATEEASSLVPYEKIVSATRSDERLDITSATMYYESNLSLFCLDARCESVIEKAKVGVEYGEEYFQLYVEHNKDKLRQYVYHFEMDKTGFYQYVGYDQKTNED